MGWLEVFTTISELLMGAYDWRRLDRNHLVNGGVVAVADESTRRNLYILPAYYNQFLTICLAVKSLFGEDEEEETTQQDGEDGCCQVDPEQGEVLEVCLGQAVHTESQTHVSICRERMEVGRGQDTTT